MKLVVLCLTFILAFAISAQTPEEWAESTYKFIANFKGEKKAFFNAFTLRLMQQNAKMMGKPLPEESTRKGIELLAEKMTGNEVVTADELKKFFNDMLKKVKGRK